MDIMCLIFSEMSYEKSAFNRAIRWLHSFKSLYAEYRFMGGGFFRFPLDLACIAAHLLSLGVEVRFIDLQADPKADLEKTLNDFKPDLCVLSCGFPSMHHDAMTAKRIKNFSSQIHVSTFGVAPTLLKDKFFLFKTWGFEIPFDSIVLGGVPAYGYEDLINKEVQNNSSKIIYPRSTKQEEIQANKAWHLFDTELYRSPFTGKRQIYVEGSYGCPNRCTFCVVPLLYGGHFAIRGVKNIVEDFRSAISMGILEISLWDEGTTFQRSQFVELCSELIKLQEQGPKFSWNTRSTTALIDEEIVQLMAKSGVTGITLGLESFDSEILSNTGKGTTIENNKSAIKLLNEAGIVSIGHIVLGLPGETRESVERTITAVIDSGLQLAQFYCAIPYPGTKLHFQASEANLIRVHDLTRYELCNAIMDTGQLGYLEVGELKKQAMERFYRGKEKSLAMLQGKNFVAWADRY